MALKLEQSFSPSPQILKRKSQNNLQVKEETLSPDQGSWRSLEVLFLLRAIRSAIRCSRSEMCWKKWALWRQSHIEFTLMTVAHILTNLKANF